MRNFAKNLWITLFVIMIMGLLFTIPVGKYQLNYDKYRYKLRNSPQRHVEAVERFVDYVQDGADVDVLPFRAPKEFYLDEEYDYQKYYKAEHVKRIEKTKNEDNKYAHPYFVRDKNNPKILYPYRPKPVRKSWF